LKKIREGPNEKTRTQKSQDNDYKLLRAGGRAGEGIFLSACKRLFLLLAFYSIRLNSFVRSSISGEGFHHINENRNIIITCCQTSQSIEDLDLPISTTTTTLIIPFHSFSHNIISFSNLCF
jgi:hypothetical protein